MSVIFLASSELDFFVSNTDGAITTETTTLVRDSAYSPYEIQQTIPYNGAAPMAATFPATDDLWFHYKVAWPLDGNSQFATGYFWRVSDVLEACTCSVTCSGSASTCSETRASLSALLNMASVYRIPYRFDPVLLGVCCKPSLHL